MKTLPHSSPSFERRFTLYEEGETTSIQANGSSIRELSLLERLARGRVKSAVSENLSKLKDLLQEGRVVLKTADKLLCS